MPKLPTKKKTTVKKSAQNASGSKGTPRIALTDKIKGATAKAKQLAEPLWKGPAVDGITQSLLGDFLVCRERFRIRVIEGLRSTEAFQHRLEYGNMWHVCEEAHAEGVGQVEGEKRLLAFCRELRDLYPMQQDQIQHWYRICKLQFPIYVAWWKDHPEVVSRTPLLQEGVFKVPIQLPSGRIVFVRGKFDSVDLIKDGRTVGIKLQENKAKGDIDQLAIMTQLNFDIQTGLYLVALETIQTHKLGHMPELWKHKILGVRYNVIRRPLSGGKGTIRKHAPSAKNPAGESDDEFYARLEGIIREAIEPNGDHFYFMRWNADVLPGEIAAYARQFLIPILEQLCDWYEWVTSKAGLKDPFANPVHWRTPYGFYSALAEGGTTEVDNYLNTGNSVGLVRAKTLFPELE